MDLTLILSNNDINRAIIAIVSKTSMFRFNITIIKQTMWKQLEKRF
jgi:hypothetical protein